MSTPTKPVVTAKAKPATPPPVEFRLKLAEPGWMLYDDKDGSYAHIICTGITAVPLTMRVEAPAGATVADRAELVTKHRDHFRATLLDLRKQLNAWCGE